MDKNIFAHQLSNFIQDKMAKKSTGFITELFSAEKICLSVLTGKEQKQLAGYKLNKRRCEWFSGRFACKKAIQEWLYQKDDRLTPLAEIEILNREDGRPYLNGPNHPALDISISHSRNYATALVAAKPCGIDIQRTEETLLRVEERFCSQDEKKILLQREAPLIFQLTKLWAAKEALQKAMAATKKIPGFLELQLLSIEREDEAEIFHIHCQGEKKNNSHRSIVHQLNNYAVALCLIDDPQNEEKLCQSYRK